MAGDPHAVVREDWLDLTREDALDPDLPIVDAHHHLWHKPGNPYGASQILGDAAAGHRIVATICVEGGTAMRTAGPEALRPVGETEMVAAEAKIADDRGGASVARGIVAYADLSLGADVGPVLDAHAEAAGGRFRGIRHATPWHADPSARGSSRLAQPGLLYEPAMREGLAELRARGLVYDAWCYHTQLGDVVDLARAMPDLDIVLNHLGGPLGIGPYAGRRDEVFADWSHWMRRLAACPNVSVKLGGLCMGLTGFGYVDRPKPPSSEDLASDWAPYIETAIELFGTSRAMFESNFPVDKGATSYVVLWNAFKRLAAGASGEERAALFRDTADRVYALGLATGKAAVRAERA